MPLLMSHVPWLVRIEPDIDNGLSKTSVADTFQVRSISQQRLIKQLGLLPVTTMTEISQALARVLSIGESI
jgi:mRNA interferase MazF